MTTNYSFQLGQFQLQRASPGLNLGITITDMCFVPGATADKDMLVVLVNNSNTLRLIERGSTATPFPSTTYTVTAANAGVSTAAQNTITFAPGATLADDLIIIANSSTTAANNTLSILRRGSTSTPFPGAATADGIDRWLISNANLGGINQIRGICLLPDESNIADDLLFVSSAVGDAVKLRRGAGAPFPGAATADGIDRWNISRNNYLGGNHNVVSVSFLKGATAAEDKLVASNRTTNTIKLVRRGTASEKFVGGGSDLTDLSSSVVGPFADNIHGLEFLENPESSNADALLSITSTGLIGFSYINSSAGLTLAQIIQDANSARGLAVLLAADPAETLFAVGKTTAIVDFYYALRANLQPFSAPTETNIGEADSPLELNAGDATLAANASYFVVDRTLSVLIDLFDRAYTWTRTSNTTGAFDGDWIFNGTSTVTGDYRITIDGATVTLGSKTTYADSFTLDADSTMILNKDVELTNEFILSAGTAVNADDATGPYVLTIPYADPGLVLGTGITLAAPEVEVTLTNLIAGSEVRIYETGTQTEVAGNEAVNGTTFAFQPTGAFDIRIFKAGFQVFRSINNAVPSTDQSIQIAQLIDRGYSDAT